MAGLSSEDKATVEKKFEVLKDPVTIILHKPEGKTEDLDDLISVLEEISGISDHLSYQDMVEMETDEDMIHDVEMFPAIVLLDKDGNDHGIRFYGIPMGRIFNSFIETIILLSNGEHGLEEEVVKKVKELDPHKLLVLATPSVPEVDGYLYLLFRMAYVADGVECAVCDLTQFPQVAEEHHVLDMPKIISDQELRFTGIYSPEETLEILEKRIGDAED